VKLWEYILRRLLTLIPVLVGVTLITFILWKAIPVDPARAFMGPKASEADVESLRVAWHLHDPLWSQYFWYMGNLLHGDLGVSFVYKGDPVLKNFLPKIPATLELTFYAMLFALPAGTYLGIVSATKRNSWVDHVSRIIAILGVAVPIYWLGVMLKIFFHENLAAINLDFLPLDGRIAASPPPTITGFYTIDSLLAGDPGKFIDALAHLVIPAFALGFAQLAIILRMTRSGMLEVLGQDYIRTARAKGVAERDVVFRHAFRNATNATLTVAGLTVGAALAGDVYVESIFRWNGMGQYFLQAAQAGGFTDLLGYVLVVTIFYVVANLIVDILYATLDPQVRLGGT
jgi:ABC-type dipeptide/oligopeptide/nickel transport system permease component